jgi:transposase
MSMDSELQKHYALLLGIGSPWAVKTVDLSLEAKKVEIELGWQWGAAAKCPECGRECSIHDCAPERTWRHLDTMQFTTLIRARTPRSDCPEHGVKIITPPRPGSMEKKGLEDAGWRVRSARVVWNLARIAARTYACR